MLAHQLKVFETFTFHFMQFLFLFSINPMPSKTFVMSYILLFCRTFRVSAAWTELSIIKKQYLSRNYSPLSSLKHHLQLLVKESQIVLSGVPETSQILSFDPGHCQQKPFYFLTVKLIHWFLWPEIRCARKTWILLNKFSWFKVSKLLRVLPLLLHQPVLIEVKEKRTTLLAVYLYLYYHQYQ